MIESNKKDSDYYSELYDKSWKISLNNGIEDYGDIEQELTFLNKINILHHDHKILELGCGIGKLCNSLYENGYKNIIGTDISETSIKYGEIKYPQLTLKAMNATKLDFDNNCFDICLSFDLVEHIPNINDHFDEIYRILVPGGYYLFQTPNILTNSIFETLQCRSFKWKNYHPSLQFSWTLKRKLKNSGFSSVRYIKIPPLSDYKLKLIPTFLKLLFNSIPWRYLPIHLQIGFWCIAYKNKTEL